MDIAIIVILLLASGGLALYDRYVVQRTYADFYAERHGGVPPLIDWFFQPDADPEVDDWRRRHRNLYIFSAVPVVIAIILLLSRGSSGG